MTSIRWRLPLSYAGIALLATLALGAVLLTTLRGYYAQQEESHLLANARGISRTVSAMYRYNIPVQDMQRQLESLAFLAQARIRVLDAAGEILVDSGDGIQPRMISLAAPPPDVLYRYERPGLPAESGVIIVSKDYPSQRGQSSINLFPDVASNGGVRWEDESDHFFVAVAGTPFGFGFNGSENTLSPGRRSDQVVRAPLVNRGDQLVGYLELLDGPAYGTDIVDGVARGLLGAGLVAVLLAAAVGWAVSRQISQPVLQLADATHLMAAGNLATRVDMSRSDELGLLASAFNRMAGRVETTVTTLRRFVADAAHELHTPITALHANLELAATEDDERQRAVFIQLAQEQLRRLETLTMSLLDLSRIEAGDATDERRLVNLQDLVWQASELYASRAEQAGLSFQFNAPSEPVMAQVNEAQLKRVVGNLLDNAIKFTPENGLIEVSLRREGKVVQLSVQDTGIGIPAEDLPLLFNRFRRGRNAAAYPGSGLGLAIIKAIIEGHGGVVRVESSGQGTCFLLQLPLAI